MSSNEAADALLALVQRKRHVIDAALFMHHDNFDQQAKKAREIADLAGKDERARSDESSLIADWDILAGVFDDQAYVSQQTRIELEEAIAAYEASL